MKLSIFAVSMLSVISFNNQALATDTATRMTTTRVAGVDLSAPPSIDVVQRYSAPDQIEGAKIYSQTRYNNPLSLSNQRQAFNLLSQSFQSRDQITLTIAPSTSMKENVGIKRNDKIIKEAQDQLVKLRAELAKTKDNPKKTAQLETRIMAEQEKIVQAGQAKYEIMLGAPVKDEARKLDVAHHESRAKEALNRSGQILAESKTTQDSAPHPGLDFKSNEELRLAKLHEDSATRLRAGADSGLMHLKFAVESPEAAAKILEKYSTGGNQIIAIHKLPAQEVLKKAGKGLVPAAVIGLSAAASANAASKAENAPYKVKIQSLPAASSSGAQ